MINEALLCGIGAAFGLVMAGFTYGFGKSLGVTLMASAIAGTVGGVLTLATLAAAESMIYHDHTVSRAVLAFTGTAFLISFGAPCFFGLPGALAGGCLHCVIRLLRRKRLE
jgi:hypothetical protein